MLPPMGMPPPGFYYRASVDDVVRRFDVFHERWWAMRFIPTKVHGMLDYIMGVVLIAAPFVLGFSDADNRAAVWVPVMLGVGALLYSLMTDYELGAMRVIPMSGHLGLDIASGLFLAASPWIFGFNGEWYMWPHVIAGLLEVGAGLFTQTHPTPHHHGPEGHGMHAAH